MGSVHQLPDRKPVGSRPKWRVPVRITLACLALGLLWQLVLGAPGRPVRTAVAEWGEIQHRDTVKATVIRTERVFRADSDCRVFFMVPNGQRIARGEPVAFLARVGLPEMVYSRISNYCRELLRHETQLVAQRTEAEREFRQSVLASEEARLKLDSMPPGTPEHENSRLRNNLEDALATQNLFRRRLAEIEEDLELERREQMLVWPDILEEYSESVRMVFAEHAGVISTVLDGLEESLNPALLKQGIGADQPIKPEKQTVDQGQQVRAGSPLFRLVDNYHLYLLFQLPPDTVQFVQPDQVYGVVLDDTHSPDSGTVEARFSDTALLRVPRLPPNCVENRFVTVAMIWRKQSGIRVPARAIVRRSGQTGVLVDKGNKKVFVPVEIELRDERFALVRGVRAGALIYW